MTSRAGDAATTKLLRNIPALILERLGEDAAFGFPEFEGERAYTLISIVPVVPPAEKADDETGFLRDGSRRDDVLEGDTAARSKRPSQAEDDSGSTHRRECIVTMRL